MIEPDVSIFPGLKQSYNTKILSRWECSDFLLGQSFWCARQSFVIAVDDISENVALKLQKLTKREFTSCSSDKRKLKYFEVFLSREKTASKRSK